MSGGIWVDDCKPCPHGCAVARTYDDLLMQPIADNRVPPRVECISWNPVGRERIASALEQLRRTKRGA